MTNTTNLYYRYTTDKTDLGCWYTETDRDDYVVVIRNGKDLREHCQQFGTAEVVDSFLPKLLKGLSDFGKMDAGSVEENGWYEPPRICWSDPSCSDPGDGGITSAIAKVDKGIMDSITTDFAEVDMVPTDEELELWHKCKDSLAQFFTDIFNKVDGSDIHED